MPTRAQYIEAATRDNTRRSYRAALRHYEEEWGGLLPATADSVSRYLTDVSSDVKLTHPSEVKLTHLG